MKSRLLQFLAVAVLSAAAIPALAKSATATIQIADPVKISGTELKPGNYELDARDTKLVVYEGRKKIAEIPVTWKEDGKKNDGTTLTLDGSTVREIHFGGKTSYVVIGG